MGNRLEEFGMQQAQNAAGGVMGMIMGGWNDSRQRDQQQKLQDMQIAGQKEMAEFNRKQQMKMWEDTNYFAQIQQLNKAGLNPGLIYGMSGGGGATTGGAGGAGPTGAQAPAGGGEMQAMMGMGIQSALLDAQRRNIEANTEKTKAETANVPLTGENTKAGTELIGVNTQIAQIEREIKGATIEESIQKAVAEMGKMQEENVQAGVKTQIDRATQSAQINTIKAQLTGAILHNEATKAGIKLTRTETAAIGTRLVNEANRIDIEAGNQGLQAQRLEMDKMINDVSKGTGLAVGIIEKVLMAIILKGR